MENEFKRLTELQSKLVSHRTAKTALANNEQSKRKCLASTNSIDNKYEREYISSRDFACESDIAKIGSILVTAAALLAYIVFCIVDVINGTDILLCPKELLSAGEVVLAVIFGIIGAGIIWGVFFGALTIVDLIRTDHKRAHYDKLHANEKVAAQKKDKEITDKLKERKESMNGSPYRQREQL